MACESGTGSDLKVGAMTDLAATLLGIAIATVIESAILFVGVGLWRWAMSHREVER